MHSYFRIFSIQTAQLLFSAYHEQLEETRFDSRFRESYISASVQTPIHHEAIAASPGRVFYFFAEAGLTGKRNDVSCE